MAEGEDGQEKSEEPSSRKLDKAREEGNLARSKELGSMLVVLGAGLALLSAAEGIAIALKKVFRMSFSISRETLMDKSKMHLILAESVETVLLSLAPLFIILSVAAVIGSVALGGFNLSWKALAPKLEKLNPISGIKRMFSVRSLVELGKAIAKFFLIAIVAVFVLYKQIPELLGLGKESINQAMGHALEIWVWSFILISLSLIILVIIDVPFQIWQRKDKLKMSKQELKDEFKDTEGKPEIKGKIRQLQRDMAQARMMSSVPEADVVITNPSHYSVALKYDSDSTKAPIVVAKGVDHVAFRIREVANHHNVMIISAPPLARAVYHTTEIDDEIPEGLYLAVAQVLAYVYRMNEFQKMRGPRPGPQPDFKVPDEFKFDE